MKKVMDHENIENHHRVKFHMLYESVFVDALNSKRSLCEQGGKKIAVSFLSRLDDMNEFFTMEELYKLRLAKTIYKKQILKVNLICKLWQGNNRYPTSALP